ncbi:MAG: lysophospholipid acyltransferase family protein [Treponemataceae bacterium]
MAYKRGDPLISRRKLFLLACHLTFYALFPIAFLIDTTLYRISVKGRWRFKDYLRQTKSKAIIVSNHTTPMDPVKMCWAVFPFSIYHTLLEATVCTPFLGTLIRLLGGMPMPSGLRGKDRFIEGIKSALKHRPAVHIYPEGECFIQNQKVTKFHQGAFLASMELNIPVFPFATVFTEPKKILGWKSCRPKATIYVLDPIFPDKFESAKEFAEFTRKKIQSEIEKRNGTNAYSKGHMERIKGIN